MASVDHHHGGEPYSTLEVRSVEASNPPDLEGSNKEAVVHPDSEYPQPVSTLGGWDASKPEAKGVDTEAGVAQGQNEGSAQRRICGLIPRTFYIVLTIAILIIIGAIVGGVAGGITARNNSSGLTLPPDSEPEPGTKEGANILSTSKLAASNWTDAQGNTHRHVFFQDPYNAIISRQWDSDNRTWTTKNISQLMSSSTTGPIHPIPGTSLACASADNKWGSLYEVHVWFSEESTDPDPTISWLNSNNPIGNPDFWTYSSSVLRTWNNTQLAVAWQRCPRDNCVGEWILAYQGREGFIRVANASNWDNNTEPVIRANAVSASASLALLPSLSGTYVHGMTLAAQRRPSSMGKTTFTGDWNWKQDDGTILDDVDPLSTRQFAATAMNNWNEAVFLALSTDGSVKGSRWDGKSYNAIPEINFVNGKSTNFSAIAMTTDATFYGISDDQIWEYTIDTSDPSTFTLAGKVYP
ncbi:hypothetical protein F5Y11DRAFT_311514 [Daldinia sp. FL1419]|nr:hypothetical protein F5Y11DRAFT_311514 [Daldinia sp. FL1419]